MSYRKQSSQGKSAQSRRWKLDIREIVPQYDFSLERVEDLNGMDCHCSFCGSPVRYVCEIKGKALNENENVEPNVKYGIGFDCLSLVLGDAWVHFRQAEREVERLKFEAACERRKEKYAEKYPEEIVWLNSLDDEWLNLESRGYLKYIKVVLTEGTSRVKDSFIEHVRKEMENPANTPEMIELWKSRWEKELTALNNLLFIIKENGEDETSRDYKFVKSVLDFGRSRGSISTRQREVLNKIHTRHQELAAEEK